MIIRSAEFDTSAAGIDDCPPPGLPEFPFIGRSNVGKSSLINMLTNRKGLARVSSTPGHTALINFFTINGAWRLVDLPGYGYVKSGEQNKSKFTGIITGYLPSRISIRRVFVLIDSRHEPHHIDLEFTSWLSGHRVPYALVFTKSDKLKPSAVARNIAAFQTALKEWTPEPPQAFASSAESREGRSDLLNYINSLV